MFVSMCKVEDRGPERERKGFRLVMGVKENISSKNFEWDTQQTDR